MANDARELAKQQAERRKQTEELVAAAVAASSEGKATSERLRQAIRNYNERLTGKVETK